MPSTNHLHCGQLSLAPKCSSFRITTLRTHFSATSSFSSSWKLPRGWASQFLPPAFSTPYKLFVGTPASSSALAASSATARIATVRSGMHSLFTNHESLVTSLSTYQTVRGHESPVTSHQPLATVSMCLKRNPPYFPFPLPRAILFLVERSTLRGNPNLFPRKLLRCSL